MPTLVYIYIALNTLFTPDCVYGHCHGDYSIIQLFNSTKLSNSNCKPKTMWNVVNSNLNFKKSAKSHIPKIYTNKNKNETTDNPQHKADILNKFFVDTPQEVYSQIPSVDALNFKFIRNISVNPNSINFDPVTEVEVLKYFNEMSMERTI